MNRLRTRFLKIYLSSFAVLVATVAVVTLGVLLVRLAALGTDSGVLEQFGALWQNFLTVFSGPVLCVWLLLMIIVAAVIAVICLWHLDKKVTKPLEDLRSAADQICAGEYDAEIIGADDAELNELCRSLDLLRLKLKAGREAENAAEAQRNLLIANISHDMRTPITTVRGYLQAIEDGVLSTPEQIADCYERISEKTYFLENLASELSEYSSAASGRLEYHFEDVELCGFLEDMTEEYGTEIESRGYHFKTEIPQKPVFVRGDRHHLQRVMQNLLSNAEKYNRPGGDITVKSEIAVPYVYLAVADNGIGVNRDSLKKVFETFYREDNSRGTVAGHGLGLAIAGEIVAAHGGKIWMQSEPGKGTEVIMMLPIKPEEGK